MKKHEINREYIEFIFMHIRLTNNWYWKFRNKTDEYYSICIRYVTHLIASFRENEMVSL